MQVYDREYDDLRGWFWSEKLDGVRFEWDGRELRTRTGNRIDAPQRLIDRMPRGTAVSGEVWGGRGRFTETVTAVKKGKGAAFWEEIKLIAFDLPGARPGIGEMIEKMDDLGLERVEFYSIGDKKAEEILAAMVEEGAEGVVYRSPEGREFVKHKPYRDAEAIVIGKVNGKASVVCRSEEGVEFRLSTYGRRIKAGSRVTYKFMERFASGKPRQPILVAVRNYEGRAA